MLFLIKWKKSLVATFMAVVVSIVMYASGTAWTKEVASLEDRTVSSTQGGYEESYTVDGEGPVKVRKVRTVAVFNGMRKAKAIVPSLEGSPVVTTKEVSRRRLLKSRLARRTVEKSDGVATKSKSKRVIRPFRDRTKVRERTLVPRGSWISRREPRGS